MFSMQSKKGLIGLLYVGFVCFASLAGLLAFYTLSRGLSVLLRGPEDAAVFGWLLAATAVALVIAQTFWGLARRDWESGSAFERRCFLQMFLGIWVLVVSLWRVFNVDHVLLTDPADILTAAASVLLVTGASIYILRDFRQRFA